MVRQVSRSFVHRLYLRLEIGYGVVNGQGRTYFSEADALGFQRAFRYANEPVFYQNVGCVRHGDIRHQIEIDSACDVFILQIARSTRSAPSNTNGGDGRFGLFDNRSILHLAAGEEGEQ